MKNRLMMLLALLAVFTISAPVLAEAPVAAAAATGDTKTDDAKAPDAKADDAKAGDGKEGDAKVDAKDEAKAEITSDDEAVAAASALFTAIQEKHWGLALGLGLSLLVFGLRKAKVLAKVPAKMLPWVTAVIGVVGYVVAALMTDGANMTDAIVGGATTGVAAVGLWEMVLKHFLSKKDAEESTA